MVVNPQSSACLVNPCDDSPGQRTTIRSEKRYLDFIIRISLALLSLVALTTLSQALPQRYDQGGPGWDETNFMTAFDPRNRRGPDPSVVVQAQSLTMTSLGVKRSALRTDADSGDGNFRLSVPIIRLPGRGLNLALDLTYDSRIWHKLSGSMVFDIDADWPAPGWTLGFGKLVALSTEGSFYGSLLIEADGTRHPFKITELRYFNSESPVRVLISAHSTDGSLIKYAVSERSGERQMISAEAKYPNGTKVEFTAHGQHFGELYPTRITDANGNIINVSYRNDRGPEISTITDTLGRIFNFHYDTEKRLTAISGPGFNHSEQAYVRLHYRSMDMLPARAAVLAAGLGAELRSYNPSLLDAIYFPSTESGYWFGDPDSFSLFGIIERVSERRGMTISATSLVEQGAITAGSTTWQRMYNYPAGSNPALANVSAYTTTETWEAMDEAPSATSYIVKFDAVPRRVEVLYPNGARHVRLSHNNPGGFNDGFVYQTEVYDTVERLLSRTTIDWSLGDYHSPRPHRIDLTDELGRNTASEIFYGPVNNQVEEIREYDYGGKVLLRRSRTEYETNPAYADNHILNLPTVVQIFAGYDTIPISRTEFRYDAQPLQDTPGIRGHSPAFNPHVASTWMPKTDYRGNITQIIRYKDAGARSGSVVEDRRYDIAGNFISVSGSCCVRENLEYTANSQYAYPTTHTVGSADPASLTKLTTRATYDFGTGVVLTMTYPSGATRQVEYDPKSLRPREIWWPHTSGMGRIVYAYDSTALTVSTRVMNSDLSAVLSFELQYTNGLGQVHRTETLAEGKLSDVVEIRYDKFGRLWQQTRPFREGEAKQWWIRSYDVMDRVVKIRRPDGSEEQAFFNEVARPSGASSADGQTVRVVDPWGRERWSRSNALGQLQEVIEPAPTGGGSVFAPGHIATYYTYDVLNRLIEVIQLPRPQQRRFAYDSLGRLTHQYLPEKLGTLTDVGDYRKPGSKWSDVFTYDDRSNLISHTDARGVKKIFEYRNDELNRLQTVRYDIVRIPMKPATDSDLKPASHSDFIPAGVPI